MRYAPEAHHSLNGSDVCLPGTRVEVIDAIVHWAARAALPVTPDQWQPALNHDARVLWVCGLSGAGKSTILRSVAARLKELGRLGAFYGFKDATQATTNPSTLFSTIARDLADGDYLRKKHLAESIKGNAAIQTTIDCREQFQHFIVAPWSDVPSVGDTLLAIDAFDESGTVIARRDLLTILAQRVQDLPSGFRVIITSRYERDVQEALESASDGVDLLHLETVPSLLTSRDIEIFVRHTLDSNRDLVHLNAEKGRLALNAEDSFQWASTACRFVLIDTDETSVLSPRERLEQLLVSHPTLDTLYTTILDRSFARADPGGRPRLNNFLGLLVCALEPLSLRALVGIACGVSAPSEADLATYQRIARHLASLISGTDKMDTPLKPLHTSFADFLRDPARSVKYYVDPGELFYFITVQCFAVMENGLHFNICDIPTSFKPNDSYEETIAVTFRSKPSLSYACRFWPSHVAKYAKGNQSIHLEIMDGLVGLFRFRILGWLEVMSLLQQSVQEALHTIEDIRVSSNLIAQHSVDLINVTGIFQRATTTDSRDGMLCDHVFQTHLGKRTAHLPQCSRAIPPVSLDQHTPSTVSPDYSTGGEPTLTVGYACTFPWEKCWGAVCSNLS